MAMSNFCRGDGVIGRPLTRDVAAVLASVVGAD
jgi:hypothetical protein